MPRKRTIGEFIFDARAKHPNADYAYYKFCYTNNSTKGIITCPVHGDFEQTPSDHLQGYGCPPCGRKRMADNQSSSRDEFIAAAKARHPEAGYNYDKFEYIGSSVKGIITCSVHGDFKQQPSSHLQGRGCPKCGRIRTASSRRFSRDEFIAAARKRHPEAGYKYDKFVYVNAFVEGAITCSSHGDFVQKPYSHLQGRGCPRCGLDRRAEARRTSRDEFITAAKARHPDAGYSYEKFLYVNCMVKGTITCPIHGDFKQVPNSHLSGNGCPKCAGTVSRICTAWLDDLGIAVREYPIRLPNRRRPVRADGYDPETKTVYEFLGDYFHGNPAVYNLEDWDSRSRRRTYRQKYERCMCRIDELRAAGYNVVTMWESEFRASNPGRVYRRSPPRTPSPRNQRPMRRHVSGS